MHKDEAKIRVGGNGEIDSNTHIVFEKLYGDNTNAEYINAGSFEALALGLKDKKFKQIIAPIHNSIIGKVVPAHDALKGMESVIYELETYVLPIQHALIAGNAASLETITNVYAYTAALDQCAQTIKEKSLKPIYHPDTSGAAREVIERNKPNECALAPPQSASRHGGQILIPQMSDNSGNETTFKIYALNS